MDQSVRTQHLWRRHADRTFDHPAGTRPGHRAHFKLQIKARSRAGEPEVSEQAVNILQLAGCLLLVLLLGIGIYLPVHDRHPIDFLFGGVLVTIALAGIAMILHIQPTLYLGITLVCVGIVVAHVVGIIPERCYIGNERRRS